MSNIERRSETELVAAFHAGDPDAFAEIYDRYSDQVFSSFMAAGRSREEAANATHDTFIEAAAQLELQDQPADLQAWLLDVADTVGDGEMAAVGEDDLVRAPAVLRPRVLSKVDRGVTAPVVDPRPELKPVGVFVMVALVVGLIGFLISAQVDPLPPLPTTPQAQGPQTGAGADATTTTGSTPSTSVAGDTTTPPTSQPPSPAAIEVSTDTVDFGDDATVGELTVSNSGGQAAEWALATSSEGVALSADRGELEGGDSVVIDLSLDRDVVEEGEFSETLTLTWSGGEVEIAIVGTHDADPIIHNPQASPAQVAVSNDSECANTQTTISARVRDNSPLESVVVRWSPDGGSPRETEMVAVGTDMFESVVGPFTAEGNTDVRVIAFDDRSNAGGATVVIEVLPCP
jgi:hypothetical protein